MASLIRRSVLSLLLAWSGTAIAATPEVLPQEGGTEVGTDVTPSVAPTAQDLGGADAVNADGPAAPAPPLPDPSTSDSPASSASDGAGPETDAAADVTTDPTATPDLPPVPNALIDRAHRGLHSVLWRSAMQIDQWFGADMPETTYQSRAVGSITPAVLWDERNGVRQSLKFRVKIPLPYLGQRYQAFIGTFNRDEFVTEREQASGVIPRSRVRSMDDDQETLLGIGYRNPEKDSHFDADAGIRIRAPLDPFVKGSYRNSLGAVDAVRLGLRETVFWQNSEGLGVTSRVDLEHLFRNNTLLSWATSATFSQESKGVRGYTAITSYRPLSTRRAIGAQVFVSREFDAEVPLEDYGLKLSYRQSVWRDWLVLEVRPSATYPKEFREEERKLNLGIGVGFEIFFGVSDFQARPAMF